MAESWTELAEVEETKIMSYGTKAVHLLMGWNVGVRLPDLATNMGGPLWKPDDHGFHTVDKGAPELYDDFYAQTRNPLYKQIEDDLFQLAITQQTPVADDFFKTHLGPQNPMLRDIVRRGQEWVGTDRAATPEELEIVKRFYTLELDKLLLDINTSVTRRLEADFRKSKAGPRKPYDFRGWWTDDEGNIPDRYKEFQDLAGKRGYDPEPMVEAIRALQARVENLPGAVAPPSTLGSGLGVQLGIALAAGLVLLMAEGAI